MAWWRLPVLSTTPAAASEQSPQRATAKMISAKFSSRSNCISETVWMRQGTGTEAHPLFFGFLPRENENGSRNRCAVVVVLPVRLPCTRPDGSSGETGVVGELEIGRRERCGSRWCSHFSIRLPGPGVASDPSHARDGSRDHAGGWCLPQPLCRHEHAGEGSAGFVQAGLVVSDGVHRTGWLLHLHPGIPGNQLPSGNLD